MPRFIAALSLVPLVACVVFVWGKPVTPDVYAVFIMPAMLAFWALVSWFTDQVIAYRKGQPVPSKVAAYLRESEAEQWQATESRRNTPPGLG